MKQALKNILVSHQGKQYVHQLCYALQKKGLLQGFITSIWYKPDSLLFRLASRLPKAFYNKLVHSFKKRSFAPLDLSLISQYPYYEFFRQLAGNVLKVRGERGVFFCERKHDKYVSQQLDKYRPDIFIGYEKSSLLSFKKAKTLGAVTVLDLAQVHYEYIRYLRDHYAPFKAIIHSEKLFDAINTVKGAEYKEADYIMALSSFAKDTLVQQGIPQEKVYTVNLGFDPARFKLKSHYRKEGVFKILFVGTITKRKGIQVLLEAFKSLDLPGVELTMVGPMYDGQDVFDQYKGMFTYVPFLHHEELVKYYQDADLFVFPSLLDSWAMTVLEAMACGTPVIVSENTGAKDAVKKGGGEILPIDNVPLLKEKITHFYQNRNALESLGKEAHEIAQEYSWEQYYARIAEVMEEIWAKKQRKVQIEA
ncbi:glycosyltransferase family 4 protein [Rapidithrix thailandica]|uniref:Glycosyltransferase family 4 protein n=1 Tax=Rapidithrix thailandica TaxID=413964 RepID=A0AAW9S9Y1_9BACT